ncbi:MAG: endolytic transglycosylase MltG [Rhodospirillales bacterium]
MARRALFIFSFLFTAAAVIAAIALWGHSRFTAPGPLVGEMAVIIPHGAGFDAIAGQLTGAGVLADPLVFRIGARISGADKGLRAGEYMFTARISAEQALALLKSGKTVVRRLTVAEGLTVRQVVDQLQATEGLSGEIGRWFAEGSLLPETYHFSYGDLRLDVLKRMNGAMSQTLTRLWGRRLPGLPLKTPAEALILASMVEKETAIPEERARIAGVFMNRLGRGMRLQSDPTVSYGLTLGAGPLGRALSRADLAIPTPYNTYLIDGLPPGPISNPGRQALAAVMRPLETDELYFVADGAGGHVFARTLKEHNRNAAKWRKLRKDSAAK